jgi:hypothetical protein
VAYQVTRIESIVSIPLSYHIKMNSYPQVYPQKYVTDYIIRQSRSGVKWRIVEKGAFSRRAS